VEIDPKFILGWVDLRNSYAFGRRFDEALAAWRRIVELEPTAQNVHFLLLDTVRFGRSGDELRAWVASLSPQDARSGATWEANILLGEYAKNIASDVPESFALKMAWALAAKGDLAAARARLSGELKLLRERAEAQPGQAGGWSRLALSEAVLGHGEAARRHAEKAVELVPASRDAEDGAVLNHNLSVVLAWTGDKTAALALLSHLLLVPGTCSDPNNPLTVTTLRRDPRYSPLWGDPRFEALLNDPKNNQPLF
jgi:tetratricopeptide (TPR) repeat protein